MKVLVVGSLLCACSSASAPGKPAAPCADLAACQAACAGAAQPHACRDLGRLLLRQPMLDLAAAAAAYRKGCDAGDVTSCTSLGLQMQDGRGVAWDEPGAAALYQRACDGGDGVGCFNLANMYVGGTGVAQDRAKADALMNQALALYQPECDAEPLWCVNIGYLYESGLAPAAPVDLAKAAAAYRKGCDRADPEACASLAQLELDGRGVPQDRAGATALLEKTCAAGGALACGILGRSLEDAERQVWPRRARELVARSCALGNARSCGMAGALYTLGHGGPVDLVAAAAADTRACDLGDSTACLVHAHELEATDARAAADYDLRACHIGLADGCAGVARLMMAGRVSPDDAQLRALVARACSLGDTGACTAAQQLSAPGGR